MAVYVDDMNARYRGMVMCHMLADTTEELLAMADKIGMARKWIQKAGTPKEHFDVCLAKKALAVRAGAQAVTLNDTWAMIKRRMRAEIAAREREKGAGS